MPRSSTAKASPASTLLVVDDERRNIVTLKSFLPRLFPYGAFHCIEALSYADAALALQTNADIHGLIVDVDIRGDSGLPILNHWRRKPPSAGALKSPSGAALLTAGHGEHLDASHDAYALGAAFLSKPIGKDAFRQFLSSVQAARWGIPASLALRFTTFVFHHELSRFQADLLSVSSSDYTHARAAERLGVTVNTLKTRMPPLRRLLGVNDLEIAYEQMAHGGVLTSEFDSEPSLAPERRRQSAR